MTTTYVLNKMSVDMNTETATYDDIDTCEATSQRQAVTIFKARWNIARIGGHSDYHVWESDK